MYCHQRGGNSEDIGTHWCLGALYFSPNIVGKFEVSFRVIDLVSDLQVWLCREHRINHHIFDSLGC